MPNRADSPGGRRGSPVPILIALALIVVAGLAFGIKRYNDVTQTASLGADRCSGAHGVPVDPATAMPSTLEIAAADQPVGVPVCLTPPPGVEILSSRAVLSPGTRLVEVAPSEAPDPSSVEGRLIPDPNLSPEATLQIAVAWFAVAPCPSASTNTVERIDETEVTYALNGGTRTATVASPTAYIINIPAC
jgi:hypothetical protein